MQEEYAAFHPYLSAKLQLSVERIDVNPPYAQ
jgi:hypothetical protein